MNLPIFPSVTRINLILGDQLNHKHSWFTEPREDTLFVIAELYEEASYVPHHAQKICAFFLAMQKFAESLAAGGHQILHLTLDDTQSINSADELLRLLADFYSASQVNYQRPDEHRLLTQLRALDIPAVDIKEHDTEHFLVPFQDLTRHFKPGKAHRMEQFYRKQRKQLNILIDQEEPLGGQWNYDATNRRKLKTADLPLIPEPLTFANDVSDILQRLMRHQINFSGTAKQTLALPADREQSLALLDYFCDNALPRFGDFQDAMTDKSEYSWSLFHSRLSFSINVKLLHPKEVIDAAVDAFERRDDIDISQVEGFVRQILGWREFIRGIYWANMPNYGRMNALNATRALPGYFWTGDTKMNCVSLAVHQSLEHSYAHHIQRLMVTGVFGLITGIDPDALDQWYLGIYSDAIEWVELPNTRGMSQFADDGIVASKPYAASGNYINKMSDYCKECHYKVKEKTTDQSCPFNALYWDFMVRRREKFERNPRIGMVYRTWDKFDTDTKHQTRQRAEDCLIKLEQL
ncbi:MAG: cryptochrome/photolyase family protein [Gammaproteobacteria bacterium]|nr:cryptochrome/photolyase family protein [Gammaproteobacteria bacterium]